MRLPLPVSPLGIGRDGRHSPHSVGTSVTQHAIPKSSTTTRPRPVEHDIVWLEVPVDDSGFVGGHESAARGFEHGANFPSRTGRGEPGPNGSSMETLDGHEHVVLGG